MDVKNLFSLEGKKGFITGSTRGIGRTLAEAFIELGADVAILGTKYENAKEVAAELDNGKSHVVPYECNVTDPASVNAMIEAFEKDYGSIDFAINNAGIYTGDEAIDISPEDFQSVLDVNLKGVFLTAQAAARLMIKKGNKGSIVNTASMSGHIVNHPQTIANYNASKAGVIHLTKSLAVEWLKYGIRVNCVSPGYIQTEMIAAMDDMLPIWQGFMPDGGRLGYPEDLIGAYVYFVSDCSDFATGSDLVIDGGYTLI